MRHYRATNLITHEVVEYDAVLPQPAHYGVDWMLEDVAIMPPTPPDQIPPYSGSWLISKFAFRQRFTIQEKVTIELAAIDDPAGPYQQRQIAGALRAHDADIAVAQYIDLTRTDIKDGVNQLETYGLIATGRATEILGTPPTMSEVWNG